MRSFATTPGGGAPVMFTRIDSGTSSRTSRVAQALTIADVPTPKATHPSAPECGVCESLPMMICPGSA